jgi:pepF/M3 family oligoendopeptidase
MSQVLDQTWDLEVIFPGGSSSVALDQHLQAVARDVAALRTALEAAPAADPTEQLVEFFKQLEDVTARFREAGAFIGCLNAQDVNDQQAKLLAGRSAALGAAFASVQTMLDERLAQLGDPEFAALCAHADMQPISFNIAERRERARDRMPVTQEILLNDLAVDGYHAWSQLYNAVVGRMRITVPAATGEKELSVGQTANAMHTGDRNLRAEIFRRWEQAWTKEEELCGEALNHLGGFRLQVYRHRRWDELLHEPLRYNRMRKETLDAMWSAVNVRKDRIRRFLQSKARLLGVDKLAWHDVPAPVGGPEREVSYEEAHGFIIEQFATFSNDMAAFADRCFRDRWIEAQDRPGKRPGGFCTSFPHSRQTRIFMTYSGRARNVETLAHELGHAYHQHVMRGVPLFAQGYAMNVAETASTFAEMIVADAALRAATSPQERIGLLESKLQRGVAFFMDIHSRFLFEQAFYERRRSGLVSPAELSQLMQTAQEEAFCGELSEYHPHFWASKLHFYMTGVPFYNFPYTFGYLFSAGVYGAAQREGPAFARRYVDLLRDTGRMNVEDLAQKHLGVDLTRTEFWLDAAEVALAGLDEFVELVAR